MLPVSTPPPKSLSSSLEPVDIWIISDRFWWYSVAVVNPIGTNFCASAYRKQQLQLTIIELSKTKL